MSYQSPLSQIIASPSLRPAVQSGRLKRTRMKVRRLFFSLGPSLFNAAMCLLVADHPPTFAQGQPMQPDAGKLYDRPFPTIPVQLGDVPLAIPKQWVDSKFLNVTIRERGRSFVRFVNAQDRVPPRTPYFDVPPLMQFVFISGSTVENTTQNLKRVTSEIAARWPERQADNHGFWNWKPREYLQVSKSHDRPLEQPLIVGCSLGSSKPSMNVCTIRYYWTYRTGVRYDFQISDIPEQQWVELDRRVLELLRFLDARHPFPETR